jgi:hypothetical protein
MKIEIKSRFSLQVLFSHECEDNSVAITLAAAINAKADLYGADLYGADLYGADLYGANLRSADLRGADLYGANLRSADLRGADLGSANLRSADLGSANLRSADLRGADLGSANLGESGKLTGDRPFFQVGPIGSRQDVLAAFLTEKGVFLRAGCFFGTVEEFKGKLQDEHGDNAHAVEYRAALVLFEANYTAWPATVTEGE